MKRFRSCPDLVGIRNVEDEVDADVVPMVEDGGVGLRLLLLADVRNRMSERPLLLDFVDLSVASTDGGGSGRVGSIMAAGTSPGCLL
jgi:hypothetical protein